MATVPANPAEVRKVVVRQNYESFAWKWMRYSGFLLIPLAWIHILLQDAIIGVHQINVSYVTARWADVGWRAYDAALLAFAFAHGVNGFRQVAFDYVHTDRARRILSWVLLVGWFVISAIGTFALIAGVKGSS
jgi:succinate dehydrogenase / fumarate reductase membrane anchor subunit